MQRRSFVVLLLLGVAACTASSNEDTDDEVDEVTGAMSGGRGFVYFHGMSRLGLPRDSLRAEAGGSDLLAPSLTDQAISNGPSRNVFDFINGHTDVVVSGYSLGRIPVFRLMQAAPPVMTRVVLIDPTYDSATGIGRSIGGGIARAWLDGSESRTLLFVYGDVTMSLGGERSYIDALEDHPRAELCYVPGDHERFRKADMARALIATSCEDLKVRLN